MSGDSDDDDAEPSRATKQCKGDIDMLNVATIIIQNGNWRVACAPMLAPLKLGKALHYRSNVTAVLRVLLRERAFQWDADGKRLWHPGYNGVLEYQEPVGGSLMPKTLKQKAPAPKRASGAGAGVVPLGDATNGATRAAAPPPAAAVVDAEDAAAACETPQPLLLATAAKSDLLVGRGGNRVGTGFGNVAEPLRAVCCAEQTRLDALWVWSSNHGRMCGAPLLRVHSETASWGCHAVGEVNAFRLVCEKCDAAFNWSSAAPLPGAPRPATAAAAPTAAASSPTAQGAPAGMSEGGAAAAAATEEQPEPEPLNVDEVRSAFLEALKHQRRVRTEYSLTVVAKEIGSVGQSALSKFIGGAVSRPDTLHAIATWVKKNAPAPALTTEDLARPRDYWFNTRRLIHLQLAGVVYARYCDMNLAMGFGVLLNKASDTVKKAMLPVLRKLDKLDTQWVVSCVNRSGDYDCEFDGFHNSNRDATKGHGTFHSGEFGFCLKLITTDKYKTLGVSGVAQRHEKVALKMGLEELIVEDGYAPDLMGTDQCKGAPGDIKLVQQKPRVQEQLAAIRERREAARRVLRGEAATAPPHAAATTPPPAASAPPPAATAPPPAAATMPPTATHQLEHSIKHNWDVYHVLVTVKKEWGEQVTAFTEQLTLPKQLPKDGGGLEACEKRGGKKAHKKSTKAPTPATATGAAATAPLATQFAVPKGWHSTAGIKTLITKHGLQEQARWCSCVAELQALLKAHVPAIYGELPLRGGGSLAAPPAPRTSTQGVEGVEMAAAADSVAQQLPPQTTVVLDAANPAPITNPAPDPPAARTPNLSQCSPCEGAPISCSTAAQLEALRAKVRQANKDRMEARSALTPLGDVLRNHYFRTARYMGSLHGQSDEERTRKGILFWEKGLKGHVLSRDHRFCGSDAKCRQPGYEERAPLNEVAQTCFRCFIESDAMHERLGKCCRNAHTWDCESQAALYHVFSGKRVVCKYFAEGYALMSKLSKNAGIIDRMLQLANPCCSCYRRLAWRASTRHMRSRGQQPKWMWSLGSRPLLLRCCMRFAAQACAVRASARSRRMHNVGVVAGGPVPCNIDAPQGGRTDLDINVCVFSSVQSMLA